MSPLALVTGFGPFETHDRNPSGEVALALAAEPPAGVEVRAAVLPVSFARAPRAWDELAASAGARRAALVLGLGVQRRASFRLEARARGRLLRAARPDVDGIVALAATEGGAGELATAVDLERARALLRGAGAGRVIVSSDAGGYVCERVYHHLLGWAAANGVAGLFLHVPPLAAVEVEEQARVVRALLAGLLAPE